MKQQARLLNVLLSITASTLYAAGVSPIYMALALAALLQVPQFRNALNTDRTI